MNIYLDIDGVLLANENSLALYANELIQHVVKTFPGDVYWLTTHVWKGEHRIDQVLAPHLKPETRKLVGQIKPTEWGELKTDAIDFSKKFVWLDDDLWPDELKVLEKHNATDNFIMIDLAKDPNQLKTLIDIL